MNLYKLLLTTVYADLHCSSVVVRPFSMADLKHSNINYALK